MWQNPPSNSLDHTNLTRVVEAAPTLTTLVLLFPLPFSFFHYIFSRPNMAPMMKHVSGVAVPDHPSLGTYVQSFAQAIELRSRGGRLKSIKVLVPDSSLPRNILDQMELLRARGMEFGLVDSKTVLWDAVPPEFRVHSIRIF
ncbi:hypothetical protein B0H12DRAFT_1120475 [Mycena haematopus]|nr:hypothetical protein B0H12DRAFT_1120475 [Mycena haematopus]